MTHGQLATLFENIYGVVLSFLMQHFSHRRSRSPHRTQISHRSSSTRDRKPPELYYDSPHKTSSRSRPEEPKSRSSHRSSTHQSSQFSGCKSLGVLSLETDLTYVI